LKSKVVNLLRGKPSDVAAGIDLVGQSQSVFPPKADNADLLFSLNKERSESALNIVKSLKSNF